jgi:hypothetical protein
MRLKSVVLTFLLLFVSVSAEIDIDSLQKKVTISGYGSYQFGQIVSGYYRTGSIDHRWQQTVFANLTVTATMSQRMTIRIGLETPLRFSILQGDEFNLSKLPQYPQYIDRADAEILFPEFPNSLLRIGYFPFKYNPDVKNLGEYLLNRGGTYPQYLINDFDYPQSRMLGFNLHNSWGDIFDNDLLLTSAVFPNPSYDFSVSWISSLKLFSDFVTIGGGISLDRFLSTNSKLTSPKNSISIQNNDSTNTYDTTHYTFAGTKLMGRISFDPKNLSFLGLKDFDLFGNDELKLYCEFGILGLKNYTGLYENLSHRIPVVVGFNLPTFKILDVTSFEVEWFGSPYPNSYYKVIRNVLPEPADKFTVEEKKPYKTIDNLKWSLFLKRDILSGLSIVSQIANDHSRSYAAREEDFDYEEVVRTIKDWYWVVKLKYAF